MVTKDLITRYEMYPEDENWNTTKLIIYEYKNCYVKIWIIFRAMLNNWLASILFQEGTLYQHKCTCGYIITS